MNAPAQIHKIIDPAALNAINAWRGACLQSFAEVEEAVCETLTVLKAVEKRGDPVKLRHLVGQKLDDLDSAIGARGPFAAEGKAAAKALAEFRSHEDLRICLAHSVGHIIVERSGEWILVFRRLSIRAGRSERETKTIDKAEALAIQKALRRHTQSLCDNLRNLVSLFRA